MLVVEPVSFKASVLSNLIQNAIKFTDRGGRIEVRCREVNGKTRVDIRDFGIGIPVEMREHLFSSTSQTNRKGTEGEAGTGFGMSLVKFYITLYGGSIDFTSKTKAESETDYGTTFSIVLNTHIV
jgi:signal transduction histidine kinase